jgi:hypothetical protein
MKSTIVAATLALTSGLSALPGATQAQTPEPWEFGLTLYGYFPSVDGTGRFPQNTPGTDVSIDMDKLLDSLEGLFMGSFEVRRGRWGVFTDLVYMDFGADRSGTRDLTIGGNPLPIGASGDVRYDIEGLAWTLAGTYRLVSDPGVTMDVLAGARLIDIDQKLEWTLSGNVGSIPTPGRGGRLEAGSANWDGIIGLKGRLAFGPERRWFVPYYVDVGTGESDLTWQAMAGIGYAFRWGEVFAAWRHLDYNLQSGTSFENLTFSGPGIAIAFRW